MNPNALSLSGERGMVSRPEPEHLNSGHETEPSVVSTGAEEVFPPSPVVQHEGEAAVTGYNTRSRGRSTSRGSSRSRGTSRSASRSGSRTVRSIEGQVIGQAVAAPVVAALDVVTDGAATVAVPELETAITQAVSDYVDSQTIGTIRNEDENVVSGRAPGGLVPKEAHLPHSASGATSEDGEQYESAHTDSFEQIDLTTDDSAPSAGASPHPRRRIIRVDLESIHPTPLAKLSFRQRRNFMKTHSDGESTDPESQPSVRQPRRVASDEEVPQLNQLMDMGPIPNRTPATRKGQTKGRGEQGRQTTKRPQNTTPTTRTTPKPTTTTSRSTTTTTEKPTDPTTAALKTQKPTAPRPFQDVAAQPNPEQLNPIAGVSGQQAEKKANDTAQATPDVTNTRLDGNSTATPAGVAAAANDTAAANPAPAGHGGQPAVTAAPTQTDDQTGHVGASNRSSYHVPKRPHRTGGRGQVHQGDHSITTNNCSDRLIIDIEEVNTAPNFVQGCRTLVSQMRGNFYLNAHNEVCIRSRVIVANQPQQAFPPVEKNATVFENNANALLEAATRTAVVEWGSGRVKGKIPASALSPYTSGESNVNSKAVASLISGDYPVPLNPRYWDSVSGSLLKNLTVFDNCAMYAKLMFWAGVIDIMDYSGLATQGIVFPNMGNHITYIQLDTNVAGGPSTSAFLQAINNGDIMLTRDRDFSSDQYDLVCWLAAPGYRVTSAANVRAPDFLYVKWPEIKVTILGYGAVFAAPPVAVVSSARIREFARQLATTRGEEADLCRGMYIAFDLLGTRFRLHEDVHYRLDAFLSPLQPKLSRPRDYNYLSRILGVVPSGDQGRAMEIEALSAMPREDRVGTMALYVSCLHVFTTTAMAAMNICTTNLIQWHTGVADQNGVNIVLHDLTQNEIMAQQTESALHSLVRNAFDEYLSLTVEHDLYTCSSWLRKHGTYAEAGTVYEDAFDLTMDSAPRLSSMLVIDDFLTYRPLEWGILGDRTTADLRADIVRMTNAARVGLYSYKGCSDYLKSVNSDSPYILVPYGIQALNLVAQFFQMADHQPDYMAADYSQGLEEQFQNLPLGYATHTFDAQLHIFEPCTIWTFDWGDNEVRAPVMTADNMTIARAKVISSWDPSSVLPGVGMKLCRSDVTFLTGLSTLRIKGIKERLAKNKADTSNATAANTDSDVGKATSQAPAGDGQPAGNA